MLQSGLALLHLKESETVRAHSVEWDRLEQQAHRKRSQDPSHMAIYDLEEENCENARFITLE